MLDTLLEHGYRYAFVSNSDNLGAVLDPRILSWVAREELPFAMEVAGRTEADRKGGHIARLEDGRLVLRETAQTPEEDLASLQDVGRHRYVNTNNLWVGLEALRDTLQARDGVLGLPIIVNRKTVDPSDPDSTPVVQLETAMGAAIGVFEGAPRAARPAAALRARQDDERPARAALGRVRAARGPPRRARAAREEPPVIDLDPEHYKLVGDFEPRFPAGPPSLVECERLTVTGDVTFGRGVVVRGTVTVQGPARIEDGTELT